jgi:hypothetical protein
LLGQPSGRRDPLFPSNTALSSLVSAERRLLILHRRRRKAERAALNDQQFLFDSFAGHGGAP